MRPNLPTEYFSILLHQLFDFAATKDFSSDDGPCVPNESVNQTRSVKLLRLSLELSIINLFPIPKLHPSFNFRSYQILNIFFQRPYPSNEQSINESLIPLEQQTTNGKFL